MTPLSVSSGRLLRQMTFVRMPPTELKHVFDENRHVQRQFIAQTFADRA